MIHWHIHELFITKYIKDGDRVIELGDQFINIDQKRQGTPDKPLVSRDFYEGIEIISIDINGEHGALPLDLGKTIKKDDLVAPGDVLTDFGTIEHVKSLYFGLKNAFTLLKDGGIAIHVNPLSGLYKANHGFHYFNPDFWTAFCDLAKLELIELRQIAAYHNERDGWEQYAVYKKLPTSKFPTKKAFDNLYKLHITKA